MNDLYNVHYTRRDTNKPSIGVVRKYYKEFSHTKEEKAVHKRHNLIIDDCITPDAFEINPTQVKSASFDEADTFINRAFKEAQKKAPKIFGIGSYFRINVADGWAYYMVTAIGCKKCTVEWRGFGGGDRYQDHWFGIGGDFKISDIKPYVDRDQAWNKMVASYKRKSK